MSKEIYQKLFFIMLITISLIKSSYSFCNIDNCPPQRGTCYGNQCLCEPNYVTINIGKNKNIYCNYHVKSRYMALLLEFFFPFGVGHFYTGNILLGAIKLALWILFICMFCSVLCCVAGKVINACSVIISLLVILSILALICMQIFDLVSYGLGIYKDGNGIEMN